MDRPTYRYFVVYEEMEFGAKTGFLLSRESPEGVQRATLNWEPYEDGLEVTPTVENRTGDAKAIMSAFVLEAVENRFLTDGMKERDEEIKWLRELVHILAGKR